MNYFHSESFAKSIICNDQYCLQYPMKTAITHCDPETSKDGCQRIEHLGIPSLFASRIFKKNKINNPFLSDLISNTDFVYSNNVINEIPIEFENLDDGYKNDSESDSDDDNINFEDNSIDDKKINEFLQSIQKKTKSTSRNNRIIKNKSSKSK